MSSQLIAEARNQIVRSGMASQAEVMGCSDDELKAIAAATRRNLPTVYCSFLREFGHGAGEFLKGTDWKCEKLVAIQSDARQFLQACGQQEAFLENSFVFAAHQGYQFLSFVCNGCDDPPVYLVSDESPCPEQKFERFSDWLKQVVRDEIDAAG